MLKGVAIGAGYFSHFHYDAWQRLPNVELLALADLDEQKAKAVAEKYGIARVYTDVSTMLENEQPDFVDIITPPNTHLALVQQVADAGHHIICQKPLAPTLAEAQQMVDYAAAKGVRLLAHENWRFQPWYRQMKKMIEAGAIGDQVFSLYWQMRMGDGWQPDAYLARQPYFREMPKLLIYETGVHFIDSFRYLLGEVQSLRARLRRLNPAIKGEDAALVHFEFENGAYAILDANRYNESNDANPRFTFGSALLEGSGGSLRLYNDGRLTLQPLGQSEQEVDYPVSRQGFAGDCVYALQAQLIDALQSGQTAETEGSLYLR
ncbi:MAG: Gfo/Idh/MocA family oxidoreductase, partial [Bacteroidota bacterium]